MWVAVMMALLLFLALFGFLYLTASISSEELAVNVATLNI